MEVLINQIYHENCLDTMYRLNDNFIDLTVTSPPYDNLRIYQNKSEFNFEIFQDIAQELYRVTKKGGAVVWVVNDATIKGSETGTSFKQALYFKEVGFRLHDTMIFAKKNYMPLTHNRYEQQFEYMFVLSKGKPKIFNPKLQKCKREGSIEKRDKESLKEENYAERFKSATIVKKYKYYPNIWFYGVGCGTKTIKRHPAPFPKELVKDHITSWSNKGDLIYDPFMGSGTTAKAALELGRKFIGSEVNGNYVELAQERINKTVKYEFYLILN